MTGADQLLSRSIVIHRTARVSAGGVKGYKLTAVKVDKDGRIAIRGQSKGCRAIDRHRVYACNDSISRNTGRRAGSDGRTQSGGNSRDLIAVSAGEAGVVIG